MGTVSTVTISTYDYSVYALTADPVADADEYFAAHIDAAEWTASTTDGKKKLLVSATRLLDRAVRWSGTQTDPDTPQPLQWPRDGATCRDTALDDGVTPDNLVLGSFELALALAKDPNLLTSTGTGTNIQTASAGAASVTYFRSTQGTLSDLRLPINIWDLVGCYVEGSSGGTGITGSLDFGTDVEPYFDDGTNEFDRADGLL